MPTEPEIDFLEEPSIDFQELDFQPDQPKDGVGTKVVRAGRNVAGGAIQTLGSQFEGVALAPTFREELRAMGNETLGRLIPELQTPKPPPRSGGRMYQAGKWLRGVGDKVSEPAPTDAGWVERFLTEILPSGAGSMVTTIGTAAALRRGGVPSGMAVAGTGAAAGMGQGYDDAIRNGADEETAMYSALVNAGIGTSEAIPIAKWLDRVGGTRAFSTALKEGTEEALQEWSQQVSQNIVAQKLYDPERPWLDGATEGAAAGATLGVIGSLMSSAIGKVRARRPRRETPKAPEPSPEADLVFEAPEESQPIEIAPGAMGPQEVPPVIPQDAAEETIDFSPFDTAGGEPTDFEAETPPDKETPAGPAAEPAAVASPGVVAPGTSGVVAPGDPVVVPPPGPGAAVTIVTATKPRRVSIDDEDAIAAESERQAAAPSVGTEPPSVGTGETEIPKQAETAPSVGTEAPSVGTPTFEPLTPAESGPTVEQPEAKNEPDRTEGARGVQGTGGDAGPALESAPPVDVREPAGAGEGTRPGGETGAVPGPEVPASPGRSDEGGGERAAEGGGVGRGLRSGPGPARSSRRRAKAGTDTGGGAAATSPGTGVVDIPTREAAGGEKPPSEQVEAGGSEQATPTPRDSSTAQPPSPPKEIPPEDRNHVLPRDQDWIPAGEVARVRANLDAVKLLKQLEAENRNPTPDEKTILARYVGWGGLKAVFDAGKAAYRERPPWAPDQKKEYEAWEKKWGKLYDQVRDALTPEEYAHAASSILNAHYTSREVINGTWEIAQRLGFQGGRALETSAGVGNFLGLTPESIRDRTKWDAVELDSVSGRLMAKLYPQARTQVMGFQDARLRQNGFDLVIGNFPFAKDGPVDRHYPTNLSLHNYFFARSLDLVKPGGLIVAITSDSTMDGDASRKAREYLAGKADLVGAIRLPNNAFKGNAGTEVTTDIVILRKRDGTPFQGQPWLETREIPTYDGKAKVEVNEYFAAHPEQMLGRMSREGTMYRADQQALLPNPNQDLASELSAAADRLPENVLGAQEVPADPGVAMESVQGKVGQLVATTTGVAIIEDDGTAKVPEGWTPKQIKQAGEYLRIKASVRELIALQLSADASDETIAAVRRVANEQYDAYRKKYGPLNGKASRFLEEDLEFPLASALEDEKTTLVEMAGGAVKKAVEWIKSRIFAERTIFPRQAPTKVESVTDAYQVAMNYRGRPDVAYMVELTGKDPEEITRTLVANGLAFENPGTGLLEPAWQYLSGQVRTKLREAEVAAADNPQYTPNVEALRKVQPAPLSIEQISARLGAPWMPPKVVEQFLREKLGVEATVARVQQTGHWFVQASGGTGTAQNLTTYGIHGFRGNDMVELALNLKSPTVTKLEDRVGEDGKAYQAEVKDLAKTLEAQEKQDQVKQLFVEWLATSTENARWVEQVYNEQMNGTVAPRFEPPSWDHYPGASQDIKLRDHQKRVVTRMLQNSTLLAHAVGTGKTFAMITAAMEMRRLGLARKPMIVVQNATLEQFARSFRRLYPGARILVPSPKQREAKYRNRTMSRIATGDWDAVIIPQSFVDRLPDDPERMATWIRGQIKELAAAKIEAEHLEGRRSPKAGDLERAKKKLEEKLKDLAGRKTDDVVTFEELGVDAIFVDEAHAYKKLQFATQMENIKGLDTGASQRGLSMFMKVRWVQERNQGRNVVFATGTPVSNTIAEAWTMMRYLRPDVLKAYGMEDFDSFAGSFGDKVTQLEMTAGGTWKAVTRFAKYVNGPELIQAFRTVADVVTPEEVNLPGLPALKNGKTTAVVIKQAPELKAYVARLRAMLEQFAAMTGKQKRENSHIPLVVFGLAQKASLDMRMVDPNATDHPDSKLSQAAKRILEIYRESQPVSGAQMVFADRYQDDPDKPTFNLYVELKRKLRELGIPENEIAIVTDDIKDAKREALFAAVNEGKVRVVIGSTERMGVGVNAQQKLVALHHLDAPARPMDIEQRNGRILRQGNENPVVEVLSYGVENTLDAAMFQRLATKQRFINQILRGQIHGRSFEDAANEQSLSFEEQMAAFSGDPLAVEKVSIDNQVRQLEALEAGHYAQVARARDELVTLRQRGIPAMEAELAAAERLTNRLQAAFGDGGIKVEVAGKTYTDRTEAAEALQKWLDEWREGLTKIAEASDKKGEIFHANPRSFRINGFDAKAEMRVLKRSDGTLTDPDVWWSFNDVGAAHNVTTGYGILAGIPSDLKRTAEAPGKIKERITSAQRNVVELSGFIQQPFEREAELAAARKRQGEILAAIEASTKDNKYPYAEWLLEVPRQVNRPLMVQREQVRRILNEMDQNAAAAGDEWPFPGWQQRYEKLQEHLAKIEQQMLAEMRGQAPRVYHMAFFPPPVPDPNKEEIRQFMHQVGEEPSVSDLAKGKIGNAIYQRRTNADDFEEAKQLVAAQGGPERAIAVWQDPANGIPSMVRSLMGQYIIKQLGELEARAQRAGNVSEVDRLATLQASLIDRFAEQATDHAQWLQALRMFKLMTPQGALRYYRRQLAKASDQVREHLEPAIRQAKDELNGANQASLPDLAADPEVQRGVTEAVNQALAEHPEVQNAIRVVVSRSFGQSPTIMADLKARISGLFDRMERGARKNSLWEMYRRAAAAQLARLPGLPRRPAGLDEFTRRLMESLRGQIDAAFPTDPSRKTPRLAPVRQILEAFANPEKYAQVWASTIRELSARYPDDPRVEQLAALPAALVSPQAMRQALVEELSRADVGLGELIGRGYIVGDGTVLKDRIRAALAEAGLDLDEADARGLAQVADREWARMVANEQERLAGRIGEARTREARALRAVRSGLVAPEDVPETEIDSVIRTRLREMRQSLARTIRGHWRDQVAAGRDLAAELTTHAGLDPIVAQQLAHRIEQRFARLVANRKAEAIQRIIDRAPRAYRQRHFWEKLVEASNMGILSDESAWAAVAKDLRLPTYTPEASAEIVKMASRIQREPEGFQRDRAVVDLLDTIKKRVGVSLPSLALSLWYARLLSGPTTHALNILSNLQQLAMAYATSASRRPGDASAMATALWNGLVKALPEMAEVVKSGRVTGVRMLKAEPAGALELAPDKGVWRALRHWRLVARLMAAEDLAVFMPLREMRQVALAREMARERGLRGKELEQAVDQVLASGSEIEQEARDQAAAEGLTGLDLRRRMSELVESRRPEAIRDDALEYALRHTFNNKPYGFMGTVASHLRPILAEYPLGRLVVPFVNIVGNVTNEAMNYSPLVLPRLVEAHRHNRVYGREAKTGDVWELYAKAAVGNVLAAIVAALAVSQWDKDEKDRDFDISGPGPDWPANQQKRATGWQPWSIKLGGYWIPYGESNLGLVLGAIGQYLDAVRYGKLKDRGALAHVAYAARGLAAAVLQRGMLAGLADLVNAITKRGVERDEAVARSLARPIGSILSSRFLSQVDRTLDPRSMDTSTVRGALLAQVPFARRLGRPALNAFGEPVEVSPLNRFARGERDDRLAQVLAAKQAWIPMQTEAELGGKGEPFTPDERYEFIRRRGPALKAHLEAMLPHLETLPPEVAKEMVRRVTELHTKRTKLEILGERKR